MEKSPLLAVQNLDISFGQNQVLHQVSWKLHAGEILGIVGESGSGKSLTSLAVMGLLPKTAKLTGEISYANQNLLTLNPKTHSTYRGKHFAMIFQEPMTALNPSMKCGEQVTEMMLWHQMATPKNAKEKVLSWFEKVKLPDPERIFNAYPHELSGGQKQRVMIAIAMSAEPKILIADEPTTALDVTVQLSILELLKELQQENQMSVIFISHDLGVIYQLCDRVVVMQKGKVVEQGDVAQVFHNPQQRYTQGLIACRPPINKRYTQLPTVKDFLTENTPKPQEVTAEERAAAHAKIYAQEPLLKVSNLSKFFKQNAGLFATEKVVKAVNDVSFEIYPGETLGLVGESGSGKTTLSRCLLMLEKPTAGEIWYQGQDLAKLSGKKLRLLRKDVQIIFQDPYASLNPKQTIKAILVEPMKVHGIGKDKKERQEMAINLLEKVGLGAADLYKYPHQFSGGQRQRIGIARALALRPQLIICDESVSALDVSVQAQVLNLLNELKEEFKFSYLFISHDLSVVKYMSDRLMVLYHGNKVEYGEADEVYAQPDSDYTQQLIASIPTTQ